MTMMRKPGMRFRSRRLGGTLRRFKDVYQLVWIINPTVHRALENRILLEYPEFCIFFMICFSGVVCHSDSTSLYL